MDWLVNMIPLGSNTGPGYTMAARRIGDTRPAISTPMNLAWFLLSPIWEAAPEPEVSGREESTGLRIKRLGGWESGPGRPDFSLRRLTSSCRDVRVTRELGNRSDPYSSRS
jgi:hypothetical protein